LGGAAAVAIIAIVPAIAQPTPPTAPAAPQIQTIRMEHKSMGPQTRDQVVSHMRDMFAKLDTNRDGYVTREEADAAHKAMAGDMHERFAERLAGHDMPKFDRGAMFDKLDTNKDGAISREEYVSAQPQFNERRVIVMRDGAGGEPGAAGEHGMMRMHGMGMKMHGRMFESADANRDGKVSLQEMTKAALQHFDAADANHDGTLTPEERMQMHQRMKAEHAKPA
jgi:Ca2+-binding EF-hand superfamily protein